MAWAASTQNLYWAYEPASFHPSDFMNQVVGCLEKRGLKFPIKFFDHLRARILAKTKELSDEECLELYKGCYLEAGDKSISSTAITEFELRLRQVIEDRREKYLTHNSNLSMA